MLSHVVTESLSHIHTYTFYQSVEAYTDTDTHRYTSYTVCIYESTNYTGGGVGKGADSTKISIYLICELAFNVDENWFTILVASTTATMIMKNVQMAIALRLKYINVSHLLQMTNICLKQY